MADTPENQEVKQEEQKEEFVKCPCCGETTLRKPIDITSPLLDEYMASIITGVPFAHTYKVYDNIEVTVEVPMKTERQALSRVIQEIDRLREELPDENEELKAKLRSAIQLIDTYSCITSIVAKKGTAIVKTFLPSETIKAFIKAIKEADDTDKIVEAYDEADKPSNLSAVPDAMLMTIVKIHNDLYRILLDAGFNETFWKGIELA